MQEKFINATQTQTTTQVSTKTKVLLGLMIAASVAGMFAIVGGINKSIKESIGNEIKDIAGNNYGHCQTCSGKCSSVCEIPCVVGTPCEGVWGNDFGDIESTYCGPCLSNAGSIVNSEPIIKGGSSNLNTNYPITSKIKQKSIITKLDDGKIRYDYIIGENGEIITPQIKDIDGGSGGGCACHLGPCTCPSTCVSSYTYNYEDDNTEQTVVNNIVTQCRLNYAGTSGYTRSEINGVVTE